MFGNRMLLAAPAAVVLAAACSAETGPQPESAGNVSQAWQAWSNCAAAYGQCGGQGWTGATCCVNSTCTYQSQYYSQCVPSGGGSSSGGSSGSSSGGSSSGSSGSSSSSSSSGGSGGSCPSGGSNDQQRAAANAAFAILRAAASACSGQESGAYGGPCFATDILSSQRYTFGSGDATIVFDSSDPQYVYVPQAAKVALAIAQLDSTVASFLVQGLQWARANTNGQWVALSMPIQALAQFSYPGNSSPIQIVDGMAGGTRRTEVVTGSAWCGSEDVHFVDTSSYESGFSPFNVISASNASESGQTHYYTGGNSYPSTPFNGPNGTANPYLVMSVNGQTINWNTPASSWPVQNCPNDSSCKGTIDIDPIPYTQPAQYYDVNGNTVGAQANPFTLVVTNLYADPAHAGQWASRTLAGVQHWGTFSNPVNVLGTTVYQYVQQY